MDGVKHSTGIAFSGGSARLRRRSSAERAAKPTSSRVSVEIRTNPRLIREAHSVAPGLEASRTSADLSISQAVTTKPTPSHQHR